MDSISVREKSACEAIKGLTDKHIYNCIDPSLLHDQFFWKKFEKKPELACKDKYVLMYALGYNWCRDSERKAAEMASNIARSKGLKVIHYYYGKLREWLPDGSVHCYCEGPQELLWLFHHAEYVVCCSFHGTAFSIIYNRPFYTFHTPGNGSRMKDLVSEIGLADRYIEEPLNDSECSWDIPWESVHAKLSVIRNKSYEYLINEVNAVNKE